MATENKKYKRVMLKLSGEAMASDKGFGIDPEVVYRLAGEIKEASDAGIEIAVVVGGGNIWRGLKGSQGGMDRASADYMGMLATVINALALATSLRKLDIDTVVLSAIAMPEICESFSQRATLYHLSLGRVVIFAGGTGNPFFTTDSAAALRAIEINADLLLKATKVDGVYDRDPKKHPDAVRFDELDHDEVIARDLQVMDTAAFALCRDSDVPLRIYDLSVPGNLMRILRGENIGTLVKGRG